VGPRSALLTHRLTLRNFNWLGGMPLGAIPPEGLEVFVRVRSTRPPQPAILAAADGRVTVDLVDGESGVAPGQACVIYESDEAGARVLGGGWIGRAEHDAEAERALGRLALSGACAELSGG